LCHFGTIANFLSFIVLLFIRDQTGKGVPDTQNAFFRFSSATGGWIKNLNLVLFMRRFYRMLFSLLCNLYTIGGFFCL
jgi:hypothetical protein